MKILIYFISFCLTCILNVLHPDYQNSKVRNSLYSCCFPDFTHSKDFLKNFWEMNWEMQIYNHLVILFSLILIINLLTTISTSQLIRTCTKGLSLRNSSIGTLLLVAYHLSLVQVCKSTFIWLIFSTFFQSCKYLFNI